MYRTKAIEILELSKEPDFEGDSNDFYDAINLGIEGLKLLIYTAKVGQHVDPLLLPGETNE